MNSIERFLFLLPPSSHPVASSSLPDSPNPSSRLQAVFTLITPPSVLEKSSIFAFSLWLHTPTPCLMKVSSPLPISLSLPLLSCLSLSLCRSSHMQPRLDPAPQVRNDDEKMRGNQQRFAMLGCRQCGSARGRMKTACVEEDWSCLHIYAT